MREKESLSAHSFLISSSRPNELPIIKHIFPLPKRDASSIFLESSSEESSFPSIQSATVYAPAGICALICCASFLSAPFISASEGLSLIGDSESSFISKLQYRESLFVYSPMASRKKDSLILPMQITLTDTTKTPLFKFT